MSWNMTSPARPVLKTQPRRCQGFQPCTLARLLRLVDLGASVHLSLLARILRVFAGHLASSTIAALDLLACTAVWLVKPASVIRKLIACRTWLGCRSWSAQTWLGCHSWSPQTWLGCRSWSAQEWRHGDSRSGALWFRTPPSPTHTEPYIENISGGLCSAQAQRYITTHNDLSTRILYIYESYAKHLTWK